jgi:nitroreductase
MEFDLTQTDTLLTTTRAVRKRLDFSRAVPREVINECLELAVQAPTGGNTQGWRWVVVDDPEKRKTLANLYRSAAGDYLATARDKADERGDQQTQRVYSSAVYLAEHLEQAPVHVIPCLEGRPESDGPVIAHAGMFASIYPAVWSFQLALRARGLGTALTTLHLYREKEAAKLLGIPAQVMQVALLPVAYTVGTGFRPATRPPVADITHWNTW